MVGGTGGSQSPASRTPFSRLPYLFVFFVSRLPPFIVFLPLSCKPRCLTPYSKRECFGLVQNKKLCCKSNHPAPSNVIIEVAFLRHKFTPRGKIFSVLWTTVVRSELPGKFFHGQSFPHHTEKYRLALSFLWRISTASETDEIVTRLTQSTHVYMCHPTSFTSYAVSDLERFPILSSVRIFVFWLFSCIKFCFKPGKTLNGSQESLLGSFLWLDVSSNKLRKLAFLNFSPASRHRRDPASCPFFSRLPSPVSRTHPGPYSPGPPPPCSPPPDANLIFFGIELTRMILKMV